MKIINQLVSKYFVVFPLFTTVQILSHFNGDFITYKSFYKDFAVAKAPELCILRPFIKCCCVRVHQNVL